MRTLAHSLYLDSEFGAEQDIPHAGSALENRYVFDDAAREIKAMANRGLVEIVSEHVVVTDEEALSINLRFRRIT